MRRTGRDASPPTDGPRPSHRVQTPGRTPRNGAHETPRQWQDSKYARTTVSHPHPTPPPFKPGLPHLSLFLASISAHHSPPRLPRSATLPLRSEKGTTEFPTSISNSRSGPRRRRTGRWKRALDPVRRSSAAIFFMCFFLLGGVLMRFPVACFRSKRWVGRRAAAVAGSAYCRLEACVSWRIAAGSRGALGFGFVAYSIPWV
jgi:hypothetical protein